MKRTVATLALCAAPVVALAGGGAWDGIYQCTTNFLGTQVVGFAAINGQPDGRAVVSFPAVKQYPDIFGYGIGVVSGGQFTGTTDQGRSFSLSRNATGMAGTFGLAYQTSTITLAVSCVQIW